MRDLHMAIAILEAELASTGDEMELAGILAYHAVFMAGGARRLEIAMPHRRLTIQLTCSCRHCLVSNYSIVSSSGRRGAKLDAYLYAFRGLSLIRTQSRRARIVTQKQDFAEIEMLDGRHCGEKVSGNDLHMVARKLPYHDSRKDTTSRDKPRFC